MNKIEVICCKDCDLWNAWDKHGNLCSCAHFTQDDAAPVYTKPDDFCSYAENKSTIKNGLPVQLRIDTPFVLYQLNIAWLNIA